jgi:hypothetical protein
VEALMTSSNGPSRRRFLRWSLGGLATIPAGCGGNENPAAATPSAPATLPPPETASRIYHVAAIPDDPFAGRPANHHAGVDALVDLMGREGLKLHRSARASSDSGPWGLIAADDVVLVKVNAQWKYRGCTNSDVVRGLIQRLLDHPDGFSGEIVIVENGQGRGSLACDTSQSYSGDTSVHANANDERHTFLFLVNEIFRDRRVSSYLLDPIRGRFIDETDHRSDGYRRFENVSYPCFTTAGGRRVELREGIWSGSRHERNLKLISVPVLKHHDTGGSEITASVKHFYGLVSMSDGNSTRHYVGLGDTCGRMIASVRAPVLNVVDAIWVSHRSISGSPASTTARTNQLAASQDPVALDAWVAKSILYPVDRNPRHSPDYPGIDRWLTDCMDVINGRGGLYRPEDGLLVAKVTKSEAEMQVISSRLG